MKSKVWILSLFLIICGGLQAEDANNVGVYWKDGLRFKTADGSFEGKLKGRFDNDWASFLSSSEDIETALGDSLDDGTEFRRARVGVEGRIYKRLDFELEYDFSDDETELKDAYVSFLKVPVLGKLTIGHVKEPIGLENMTSSKNVTFMERSLTGAFTPSRNTGVMFRRNMVNKRASLALGVFKDSNDQGAGTGDGGYSVTLRATAAPFLEQKGRKLLHLGLSYSHRNADDEEVRFRARPEVHLSPRFVDTGDISADAVNIIGGEIAVVCNSLSAQAEYIAALVDSSDGSDPDFYALYGQLSYFLTGEHRRYGRSKGSFSKIKPNSKFLSAEGGQGAWEVAVRYSRIDLNDGASLGGELQDFTFGLNWYLSSAVRMMLNLVHADLEDVDEVTAAQARMQLTF